MNHSAKKYTLSKLKISYHSNQTLKVFLLGRTNISLMLFSCEYVLYPIMTYAIFCPPLSVKLRRHIPNGVTNSSTDKLGGTVGSAAISFHQCSIFKSINYLWRLAEECWQVKKPCFFYVCWRFSF